MQIRPFTLSNKEKKDINKLIDVYEKVYDNIKGMHDNDASIDDIMDVLKASHLHDGVCHLADKMGIYINNDMNFYFKRRCVPHTAYWVTPPSNIILNPEGNSIESVRYNIVRSLGVRIVILKEALILGA